MTLLQIDSLQELKNNSGFWDNFVWPLAVAVVIGIAGFLYRLLSRKKSNPSMDINQTTKIKENTNSPITGKIKNQTNNYFSVDNSILDRLHKIEMEHKILTKKDDKMSNENENRNINVTSHGQSGGITAGIINVSNSNQLIQPSDSILAQVDLNLNKLISEYVKRPKIVIEVESGNSQRHQIACDLEKIIQKFDLGVYPRGNTYMGRFPDYPITVIGNKNNIEFMQKFVEAISPYFTTDWYYDQADNFPDDFLKIYINGTPSFNSNGSVHVS